MPDCRSLHRAARHALIVGCLALAAWLGGGVDARAAGVTGGSATSAYQTLPVTRTAPRPLSPPTSPQTLPLMQTPARSVPVAPNAAPRLTALVVRAMPFGQFALKMIAQDARWPFQTTSRIAPARLRCVQQRLLPAGYQASRRQAVDAFIQRYPDQVQDAIDVLAQGGAEVMGAGIQAGFQVSAQGGGASGAMERNALQDFTPAQMAKLQSLAHDDRYKTVRELLFFGSDQFPGTDNKASSKLIAEKWLLEAISHCQIPPSALAP